VAWLDGDVKNKILAYSPATIRFTQKYDRDTWCAGTVVSVATGGKEGSGAKFTATVQLRDFPDTRVRVDPTNDGLLQRKRPLVTQLYFVHRRLEPLTKFFLYSHAPKLFGTSFVLRVAAEEMTTKDLYDEVFAGVKRFCPNWIAPDPQTAETAGAPTSAADEGWVANQWNGMWVLQAPGQVSVNSAGEKCASEDQPEKGVKAYWGEFETVLAKYPFRLCQVSARGTACSVGDWSGGSTGALIPVCDCAKLSRTLLETMTS